jgi:rhamnosyltransferase
VKNLNRYSSGKMNKKLSLVTVFYMPTNEHIKNAKILGELYDLIIVDNTPSPLEYGFDDSITLISLKDNLGIAKALNIGIQHAIEQGYVFCLLLDQDSVPETSLISGLLSFLDEYADLENVALVAPSYYDKAKQVNAPFIQTGKYLMKTVEATGNKAIQAAYAISSGSVLNLACYNDIGEMKEELFIDFVDIEWCLRARDKGYSVLGLPWLQMEHEIGDETVKFLGKEFMNHSPIRHYYYFRNIFMMLRLSHIPYQLKVFELITIIPKYIIYCLATEKKLQHFKFMTKGIWHGVIGRFGKLNI